MPPDRRRKALESLTDAEAGSLMYDWRGFWARPEQLAPDGDWQIWAVIAGRGAGKTRLGSEWIREEVKAGRARRIALIAETAADGRDVMVEGDSGILAVHPPDERPTYEPSKRRLTWPNGAVATIFNATEPDQLRGPQFDTAWSDELAKWKYGRETWDMLQFGLRLGSRPRQLVTTTPRPIELVKSIVSGKEGSVVVTRGMTWDNAAHLAPSFLEKIRQRYGGTRLGRQELEGEILGDMPGALWQQDVIDTYRVSSVGDLGRIIVAVDPAVSSGDESNEHGIIVAGVKGQEGYVLEDASISGTPMQWARRVSSLVTTYMADGVVVEVNQGGDMVAHTLRAVAPNINIIEVRASRGKHIRAAPVAALYEQGRIHHVGSHAALEEQMTQMTDSGYHGEGSPDRVDALVWAFAELFPDIVDEEIVAQGLVSPPRSVGWLGA